MGTRRVAGVRSIGEVTRVMGRIMIKQTYTMPDNSKLHLWGDEKIAHVSCQSFLVQPIIGRIIEILRTDHD